MILGLLVISISIIMFWRWHRWHLSLSSKIIYIDLHIWRTITPLVFSHMIFFIFTSLLDGEMTPKKRKEKTKSNKVMKSSPKGKTLEGRKSLSDSQLYSDNIGKYLSVIYFLHTGFFWYSMWLWRFSFRDIVGEIILLSYIWIIFAGFK